MHSEKSWIISRRRHMRQTRSQILFHILPVHGFIMFIHREKNLFFSSWHSQKKMSNATKQKRRQRRKDRMVIKNMLISFIVGMFVFFLCWFKKHYQYVVSFRMIITFFDKQFPIPNIIKYYAHETTNIAPYID